MKLRSIINAGACCRAGTTMELTPAEAEFLELGGTGLDEIVKPRDKKRFYKPKPGKDFDGERLDLDTDNAAVRLRVGDGLYTLRTDCGYLATNSEASVCLVHEDPDRPTICQVFKAGSYLCQALSQRYLNDTDPAVPVTLIRNPNLPS